MLTEPTPIYTAYSRHVSFDTLDTRDSSRGALTSLTLNYKHKDYKASRHGRTYLCGLDTSDDYSEFALEWLIDELIEDGDEVVCLRIVDRDSIIDAKRCQTEGKKLFDSVITNMGGDEKAISLAMELAVGKIHHLVQDMIEIYQPTALVVGAGGASLSGVHGLLPGSVSKHCLQQSPVPVIVARPSDKTRQKRLFNRCQRLRHGS